MSCRRILGAVALALTLQQAHARDAFCKDLHKAIGQVRTDFAALRGAQLSSMTYPADEFHSSPSTVVRFTARHNLSGATSCVVVQTSRTGEAAQYSYYCEFPVAAGDGPHEKGELAKLTVACIGTNPHNEANVDSVDFVTLWGPAQAYEIVLNAMDRDDKLSLDLSDGAEDKALEELEK
ncbi:MAG: hypothetical protein KGJ78_10250 [Alphaproteobacteria bacterium]|nr:hypothetical protein [Alphaproteobacteria bacterium]